MVSDEATANERRNTERHVTLFRSGKITHRGGDDLCLIRNISSGGAMVHLTMPIEDGAAVSLDLRLEEQLRGKIVWRRDDVVGIAFDRTIDLSRIFGSDVVHGRRPRAPRLKVPAQGRIQVGADIYRVVTDDVSQSGTRVCCAAKLKPGTEVRLWLDGLSVAKCVVRWSHGDFVGLSFDMPLSLWQLSRWIREQREAFAVPAVSRTQRAAAS